MPGISSFQIAHDCCLTGTVAACGKYCFSTYLLTLTLLRAVCLAPVVRSLQFQCEQTNDNKGCTTVGVCGKTPTVAGLQDLLIYSLKGLGSWAHLANQVRTCRCHMQQSR